MPASADTTTPDITSLDLPIELRADRKVVDAALVLWARLRDESLRRNHGVPDGDLTLGYEELGVMLGISPVTANKYRRNLVKHGWLEWERQRDGFQNLPSRYRVRLEKATESHTSSPSVSEQGSNETRVA